jgi:DNA-binding GntR family transcriptional regulator
MARVFSKQKRPTLMSQALQEIREAIRKGKLKPGDRLVEMKLAKEMHISRFPIREALRYLEKEGLVETKPFKGTYVVQLTERDMEELYSLRSAIEAFAIRILIKHIDAEKIKKLESIFDSMQQASQNEDLDKLISEDFRPKKVLAMVNARNKYGKYPITGH